MTHDAKTRKAVERALMEEHRRLWMALDAAGAPIVNEDGVELLTVEARIEALGERLREEMRAMRRESPLEKRCARCGHSSFAHWGSARCSAWSTPDSLGNRRPCNCGVFHGAPSQPRETATVENGLLPAPRLGGTCLVCGEKEGKPHKMSCRPQNRKAAEKKRTS